MSTMKVSIFPAAGALGGSVATHLLDRLPAADLVYISRHPDKLAAFRSRGVEVRSADYDDESSLHDVFRGIDALFLVSYPSLESEYRFKVHKRAIDSAITSGVKHIFYSSLAFARERDVETVAWVMQPHLDTEAYLAQRAATTPDFTYTAIREGLYSEAYPIYTAFFDLKNPVSEITIPHDGSGPGIAWAKRDELGEATAELIARYAKAPHSFAFVNKVILLSGAKVLGLDESVAILGRIANKELRFHPISDEEFAALPQAAPNLTYRGIDFSKEWTSAFHALKRGECAVATPLLRELLGREPEDFETTIRALQ